MSEHQVENAAFMANLGLRFLDTYDPVEIRRRLLTYFKFLVVRHPLDRLVSAFGDKVARPNAYGAELRRQIVARYANEDVGGDGDGGGGDGARRPAVGGGDDAARGRLRPLNTSTTRYRRIRFHDFVRSVPGSVALLRLLHT